MVKELRSKNESVVEEMCLWGYTETSGNLIPVDFNDAQNLLTKAIPLNNLPLDRQQQLINTELHSLKIKDAFIEIATQRADKLVEATEDLKPLIGGRSFENQLQYYHQM